MSEVLTADALAVQTPWTRGEWQEAIDMLATTGYEQPLLRIVLDAGWHPVVGAQNLVKALTTAAPPFQVFGP